MKKIATVGPQGTYSDVATSRFVATQDEAFEVAYFSGILFAFFIRAWLSGCGL